MANNYDRLTSPVNPNGIFGDFIDGSIKEQFPGQRERLILATADVKSFLIEVAGLDPDMAEVVAARATREVAMALDSDLSDTELSRAIELGGRLSEDVAVSRALDNILRDS